MIDLQHLFPNGWQTYLVGGVFLGSAVTLLFAFTGLVGGMSSVFSSTWSYFSNHAYFQQPRYRQSRLWRLVYALGVMLGGAAFIALGGKAVMTQLPVWQILIGAFIAGFGARLANGCTSGHGICGMASLKLPSFFAVLIFLTTAILSAHLFTTFASKVVR
jgi:uncharacterized protein